MKKAIQQFLMELKQNSTVENTDVVSLEYVIERLEDILMSEE